MKASGVFAIAALAALLILVGMRIDRYLIMREPPRISVARIERPIFLPATHAETPAKPVRPDSSRQHFIDSLIARARHADSLDQFVASKLRVVETQHPDSIVHKDSSGEFRADIFRKIVYDPISEIFKDSTAYSNALLTTFNTSTQHYISTWPLTAIFVTIGAVVIAVLAIIAR